MTDDQKSKGTRLQLIEAAAHEFAVKPYTLVNLDDILAQADVTKGAMYTHFRPKHALAIAVVEHRAELMEASVDEMRDTVVVRAGDPDRRHLPPCHRGHQ